MKIYLWSEEKQPGYYFDLSKGEFLHLEKTDLCLNNLQGKCLRVPTGMLMLAAPLLSLAYIIFLPFAGILAAFAGLGMMLRQFRVGFRKRGEEHSPAIAK